MALYGRLPFTATNWPGLEEPNTPEGDPEVPGSRMVKFCQSVPTFGSCAMDFASSVVCCVPDSVSSRGTLDETTIFCVVEPTFNCAFTLVNPTSTVTGPRIS